MTTPAIGQSFNAVNGQVIPNTPIENLSEAMEEFGELKEHSSHSVTAKLIDSTVELHEEIRGKFGAAAQVYGVTGEVKGGIANQIKATDFDTFYVITFRLVSHYMALPHIAQLQISSEAARLMQINSAATVDSDEMERSIYEQQQEFVNRYGTHVIDRVEFGQTIALVLQIKGSKKSKLSQLNASTSLSLPVGNIKNEAEIAKSLDNVKKENLVDMYFFLLGSKGDPYKMLSDQVGWIRELADQVRHNSRRNSENSQSQKEDKSKPGKKIPDKASDQKAEKKGKQEKAEAKKEEVESSEESVIKVMKENTALTSEDDIGKLTQLSYTTSPYTVWINSNMLTVMYKNVNDVQAILESIKRTKESLLSRKDIIIFARNHPEILASNDERESTLNEIEKKLAIYVDQAESARKFFSDHWLLLYNQGARSGNLNPETYLRMIDEIRKYIESLKSELIVFDNPPKFLIFKGQCAYSSEYKLNGQKGRSNNFHMQASSEHIQKLYIKFSNSNETRDTLSVEVAPEGDFELAPRILYIHRPKLSLIYSLNSKSVSKEKAEISEQELKAEFGEQFSEFAECYLQEPLRIHKMQRFFPKLLSLVASIHGIDLNSTRARYFLSSDPDLRRGALYLHQPQLALRYTMLNSKKHIVEGEFDPEKMSQELREQYPKFTTFLKEFLAQYFVGLNQAAAEQKAQNTTGTESIQLRVGSDNPATKSLFGKTPAKSTTLIANEKNDKPVYYKKLQRYFPNLIRLVGKNENLPKDEITVDLCVGFTAKNFFKYMIPHHTDRLYEKLSDGCHRVLLPQLSGGMKYLRFTNIKVNGVNIDDPNDDRLFDVFLYAESDYRVTTDPVIFDPDLRIGSPNYLLNSWPHQNGAMLVSNHSVTMPTPRSSPNPLALSNVRSYMSAGSPQKLSPRGKRTLSFNGNPASLFYHSATSADGDCAFHSIFGNYNIRSGKYECTQAQEKRNEVAIRINACASGGGKIYELAKASIFELLFGSSTSLKTPSLVKLKAAYDEHLKTSVRATDEKFNILAEQLKEDKVISEYLKNENKENIIVFKDLFFACLNKKGCKLKDMILASPELAQAYIDFTCEVNRGFDLDGYIQADANILTEYGDLFRKPKQWLLPSEVHIIALVFDITVHYHITTSSGLTQHLHDYNQGKDKEEVSICFVNSNHFERIDAAPKVDEETSEQLEQSEVTEASVISANEPQVHEESKSENGSRRSSLGS